MVIRRLFPALVLALLVSVALPVAQAAAGSVTNTNDSGPGSLRQAISDAAPGETIAVPAGDYGLASGELVVNRSLNLVGAGTGATTIKATGAFRIFSVSGAVGVTISGITIRDGKATGAIPAVGGGIYVHGGANVLLSDDLFTENSATSSQMGATGPEAFGGAVYVNGAVLELVDSVVSNNFAAANGLTGKAGGGASGGGIAATNSQLTVARSTVSGNLASAIGGQGPSDPAQLGGIPQGGGIYASGGLFTLSASTVSANAIQGSSGPGATMGGIDEGGGVYLRADTSRFSIENSTVSGNTATGSSTIGGGGGVFGRASEAGTIALSADTIAGNSITGASGGNLKLTGANLVRNTILSGGAARAGAENCAGAPQSGGFNLDSTQGQCGFNAGGDRVGLDPLLGPLADNGGPTATMLPAPASPALDSGSSFGLNSDQRGLPRPADLPGLANAAGSDGADIGAVEVQPAVTSPAPSPPPAPKLTLGKLTRNTRKGTAALAVAIANPNGGSVVVTGVSLKTGRAGAGGTTAVLPVVPGKLGFQRLRRSGRYKVKLFVSLLRADNSAIETVERVVTLTEKRRPRPRRAGHPQGAR